MELRNLFDENRNLLEKINVRGTPIKKGEYILAVGIWVITPSGKLFITLRSDKKPKDCYPNLWENTAGSVLKDESSLDGAVRELFEETGIVAHKDEFKKIYETKEENAFFDIYTLKKEVDLSKIVLQEEETSDCKLVTLLEFENMIKEGIVAKPVEERFYQCYDLLLKEIQ
ncbi:MAG: NUDIX hydrolase [Lachnospirales bacterium]